jgi:hypothetical protein
MGHLSGDGQVDESGVDRAEPTTVQVEGPKSGLEVHMEPATSLPSSAVHRGGDDLSPYPLASGSCDDGGVEQEGVDGSVRLAWTQGVSRSRWLAGKLGLGMLASMGVAGLLSLMVTWWSSPIDRVQANLYDALAFGVRDIAPIGYAAFAFVLGLSFRIADASHASGNAQPLHLPGGHSVRSY